MGAANAGFTPSKDFPPAGCREGEKMVAWYREVFEKVPMKEPAILNSREKELLRLSAQEYVEERKQGRVTCEEYTSLLVKRARYYRYMNQWTFRSYELFEVAVVRAKALDEVAKKEGVEAIAPLYGLPIPMKGTAAVVDFPAGCGVSILSHYTPVKNSELTELIYQRNGIIFGTSNVPEFAASVNTMNIASGQCRNPYNHAFLPGGSSGGAGSAVSMYMCPVAVSEDTGGSTRVPALCNGLFGFDPARNYYPNEGNAGMTVTKDQIGVVCRSMRDLIFYDKALMQDRFNAAALHAAAEKEAKDRQLSSIGVACPQQLFCCGENRQLDSVMRAAYEAVKAALGETKLLEVGWSEPLESPKEAEVPLFAFPGMVAHFVFEYLDAPVSIKEIAEAIVPVGAYNPQPLYYQKWATETEYRFALGPLIKQQVEQYNSLFDEHGLDFILVPAAYNPTPDLAQALSGTIPAIDEKGEATTSDMWQSVYPINQVLKNIHIPKLAIPTGLTEDGRPTGVQLWGRAVPYEEMYQDDLSAKYNIRFLHLAARVVKLIEEAGLQRVTPSIARDLFT